LVRRAAQYIPVSIPLRNRPAARRPVPQQNRHLLATLADSTEAAAQGFSEEVGL